LGIDNFFPETFLVMVRHSVDTSSFRMFWG